MLLDSPPAATFAQHIERSGTTARVRLEGEVDIAAVPAVRDAVDGLRRLEVRRILVDLSAVTFMDSSGVTLALELDAASRGEGHDVRIVRGPRQVQRVFDLTGVTGRVPFLD